MRHNLLLAVIGTSALATCSAPPTANAPTIVFEPVARPVLRAIAKGATRDPSLAFDSGGSLWIGAAVKRATTWGYAAFSSRDLGDHVKLAAEAPVPSGMMVGTTLGPRFGLDRNEQRRLIYAVDGAGHDVEAATSSWIDETWHTASVRDRAASRATWAGFEDLATSGTTLYASWLDERNHRGPSDDVSEVWFSRSTDGVHFEPDRRVAAHTCSCCRTAVVANGNNVYVAFRGNYPTDVRDMAVASSHDAGKTFATPVRVASDGWAIHGCPESGPSLLVSGSRLWMAWFTLGSDEKPRIRLSWSDDGGVSFAPAENVSGEVLDANQPRLARAANGGALLVFEGRAPSEASGFGHTRAWIAFADSDGRVSAPIAATPATIDARAPVALMPDADTVVVAANSGDDIVVVRGRIH